MKPKRKRHISKLQDRDVMARLGGRVQPASGSLGGNKGDGRVYGRFRVETKYTKHGSFPLKLVELFKIAAECGDNETPVFVVDFKDGESARVVGRFAVIPFSHFEKVSRETDDNL